jgi:hypothetical protein
MAVSTQISIIGAIMFGQFEKVFLYNANMLEQFVGGENQITALLDFSQLRSCEVGW